MTIFSRDGCATSLAKLCPHIHPTCTTHTLMLTYTVIEHLLSAVSARIKLVRMGPAVDHQ